MSRTSEGPPIPACCKICGAIDDVRARQAASGWTARCEKCDGPQGTGATRSDAICDYNAQQSAGRHRLAWHGAPKQTQKVQPGRRDV